MKNKLVILAFVVVYYGCDNRKDPYFLSDKSPEVYIKWVNDTAYKKEISDSNKIGIVYQVNYKYIYDENAPIVSRKTFANDSMVLVGNSMYINNKNEGLSKYSIRLTDSYGKSDSAVLKITSFRNLPPVCYFTTRKYVNGDSLAIVVNATKSYDLDHKWGGQIIKFEYNLNGLVQTNSVDSIVYLFGNHGQKRITVKVMDNDNAWSQSITKFVTL